jgi:FemAB-related protein (PEP-CTERM system-associated)
MGTDDAWVSYHESSFELPPAPKIVVRECHTADRLAWDRLMANRPDAGFFHLFSWKTLNERAFGHECVFLAAFEGERMVGALPLTFIRSRIFGRIMCSMPFIDYSGPVAATAPIRRLLVEAAQVASVQRRAQHLEIRTREPFEGDWKVLLHKHSYAVDLRPGASALWQGFSRKHRKNIRRAYKNDLEVLSGEDELLKDFYAVLGVSWRNLGSPLYAQRFFEDFMRAFGGLTRIFVVRHGGKPVAVALTGSFNACVDGLWAGMVPQARCLQANYVLYWEMIKYFADQGASMFSLGRSSVDSAAEQFKEKWNAVGHQLYWNFWPPTLSPRTAAQDPKYQVALAVWKRLPISVTGRIGPFVAPYFS